MNRCLSFSLAISITLSTLAIPLRAANKPRAGEMEKTTVLWTNQDLERLRALGLISIVGQPATVEDATVTAPPLPYVKTQDPEWYAERAAKLRAQIHSRKAELQQYRLFLEHARDLKTMTGGINFDRGDIGITPVAAMDILQQRVRASESQLDALEDRARHNGIPPGVLRSSPAR